MIPEQIYSAANISDLKDTNEWEGTQGDDTCKIFYFILFWRAGMMFLWNLVRVRIDPWWYMDNLSVPVFDAGLLLKQTTSKAGQCLTTWTYLSDSAPQYFTFKKTVNNVYYNSNKHIFVKLKISSFQEAVVNRQWEISMDVWKEKEEKWIWTYNTEDKRILITMSVFPLPAHT